MIALCACHRLTITDSGISSTKEKELTPHELIGQRLVKYSYEVHGSMAQPNLYINVTLNADSTTCSVQLYDFNHGSISSDYTGFVPEEITKPASVLHSIMTMLIEAKAWKFKERYTPPSHIEIMDGNSWRYEAITENGYELSASGYVEYPDTKLFKETTDLIIRLFEEEKNKTIQ